MKKITEYYDFFEIETSDIDQSDENDEEKEIKLESYRKKAYLIEATKKNRGSFSSGFREGERERFMRERVCREREGTCFGERELNGQQKPF